MCCAFIAFRAIRVILRFVNVFSTDVVQWKRLRAANSGKEKENLYYLVGRPLAVKWTRKVLPRALARHTKHGSVIERTTLPKAFRDARLQP